MQVVHQGAQNQSRTGRPASVVSSMSPPPMSGADNISASGASADGMAGPLSLGSLDGVGAVGGVGLVAGAASAGVVDPGTDGAGSDGAASGDVDPGSAVLAGALVAGASASFVAEPHAARRSPAARTGSRRRITAGKLVRTCTGRSSCPDSFENLHRGRGRYPARP